MGTACSVRDVADTVMVINNNRETLVTEEFHGALGRAKDVDVGAVNGSDTVGKVRDYFIQVAGIDDVAC